MTKPKALFFAKDGTLLPENLICSGALVDTEIFVNSGNKGACQYYIDGVFPDIKPLDKKDPGYNIDKGNPGDLSPTCALCKYSTLEHAQTKPGLFPKELLPLRVFKCRMWFFLVIPGLYDNNPQLIQEEV
jgi:hypothetical protein